MHPSASPCSTSAVAKCRMVPAESATLAAMRDLASPRPIRTVRVYSSGNASGAGASGVARLGAMSGTSPGVTGRLIDHSGVFSSG